MTVKEFGEKVMSDEALRQKMHELKSVEEGYAIAKGMGVTVDQETFLAEMLKGEMEYLREHSDEDLPCGELRDEDLLKVSGGNEGDFLAGLAMCGCA